MRPLLAGGADHLQIADVHDTGFALVANFGHLAGYGHFVVQVFAQLGGVARESPGLSVLARKRASAVHSMTKAGAMGGVKCALPPGFRLTGVLT